MAILAANKTDLMGGRGYKSQRRFHMAIKGSTQQEDITITNI